MRKVLEMSEQTFRLLQEFVYENTGIRLGPDQIASIERRLSPVCETLALDSLEDLYAHARYHPKGRQTLEAMIEALTTHETYLNREASQFELVTREILAPGLLDPRTKIRILSAGCSSGEELVSLMIWLEETGLSERYRFEFVGADISNDIIQKARSGLYRESAFRSAPAHWMRSYFEPENGVWRVAERFRQRVQYVQLNLLDSFRFRVLGEFDIIFCRNVMIYFDKGSKTQLVNILHRRLSTGGYLLLGHAENLIQIDSPFMVRHFQRDMIYQKIQNDLGETLA